MSELAGRLTAVKERIAASAARSGRRAEDVALVAVSKTDPAEAIREALEAGQSLFGESRVQEALAKIPLLPSNLSWHFVGHLQTNKIRKALPHFDLFHGVDSADLVRDMDRIA